MKTHKLMQLIKDNAQESRQSIRMDANNSDAHIYIYDVIDSFWGASASDLLKSLADAGDKTVHLHINSPGGDVFEARAMAAAIVAYAGKVITHIDGICASAATYLALSGSEIRMTDGGLFMVHNSWTMAMGDCNELRSTADLLQKIDGTINASYAAKTGKTTAEITAWMDAETWFTSTEALDAGFIDAIDANTKQDSKASAQWNLSAYANAPINNLVTGKKEVTFLNSTEDSFLASMIANESECVSLCTEFIKTNPQATLRDYAEDELEDCAGSLALLQVWKAVGAESSDGAMDSIDAQLHINRNRMRLLAQKRI